MLLLFVNTARFILSINKCLLQVVQDTADEEETVKSSKSNEEVDKLSIRDSVVVGGLLDTLVILWEGSAEELNKVLISGSGVAL